MTFKELAIDYVKDTIPDNEFILMGSNDITEEITTKEDSNLRKKKIIIEWTEFKGKPKELRCDTCKWNDEELSGECYDCVKGIEDRYEPIEEGYITAEEYMKTGKWIGD